MINEKLKELKALDKTIEGNKEKKEKLIYSVIADRIKLHNIKSKYYYVVVLETGVITGNNCLKALCEIFQLNYGTIKKQNYDTPRFIKKLGGTIKRVKVEDYV